jgi:hypothetical protein
MILGSLKPEKDIGENYGRCGKEREEACTKNGGEI